MNHINSFCLFKSISSGRSQSAAKNTFTMYDWGRQGNLKEYGQVTPPKYDLSKMPPSLPVALFTGSTMPSSQHGIWCLPDTDFLPLFKANDYLATPADVARLKKELSTCFALLTST